MWSHAMQSTSADTMKTLGPLVYGERERELKETRINESKPVEDETIHI